MKQHSTNYLNTFISAADDCPARTSQAPPDKAPKSAIRQEFELLWTHPYRYTSDDVVYLVHGKPKGMEREAFFAKGRPCFRTSALTKRYGWGIHFDEDGRAALYGKESEAYRDLAGRADLVQLKAIRNKK